MVADVISHFKVKSPWNEVQLVLKVHTAEERNQRNLNKQEIYVPRTPHTVSVLPTLTDRLRLFFKCLQDISKMYMQVKGTRKAKILLKKGSGRMGPPHFMTVCL